MQRLTYLFSSNQHQVIIVVDHVAILVAIFSCHTNKSIALTRSGFLSRTSADKRFRFIPERLRGLHAQEPFRVIVNSLSITGNHFTRQERIVAQVNVGIERTRPGNFTGEERISSQVNLFITADFGAAVAAVARGDHRLGFAVLARPPGAPDERHFLELAVEERISVLDIELLVPGRERGGKGARTLTTAALHGGPGVHQRRRAVALVRALLVLLVRLLER